MDNLSWLRTSWFRFIITDIATQNGIVPEVFGYEKCNEKKLKPSFNRAEKIFHGVVKSVADSFYSSLNQFL